MSDAPPRAAARQRTRALIRELVQTGRPASAEDVAHIRDLIATAPFDPTFFSVPEELQGLEFLGGMLGAREPSLTLHLVKRIIEEKQWASGTSELDYLADLQAAIFAPSSRLLVYARRAGYLAAVVTPTHEAVPRQRLGVKPAPLMLVVYSADRDIIASGYQFSSYATISLPAEVRWLD